MKKSINNTNEHMKNQNQTDSIIKLLTASGVIKDKNIKDSLNCMNELYNKSKGIAKDRKYLIY